MMKGVPQPQQTLALDKVNFVVHPGENKEFQNQPTLQTDFFPQMSRIMHTTTQQDAEDPDLIEFSEKFTDQDFSVEEQQEGPLGDLADQIPLAEEEPPASNSPLGK